MTQSWGDSAKGEEHSQNSLCTGSSSDPHSPSPKPQSQGSAVKMKLQLFQRHHHSGGFNNSLFPSSGEITTPNLIFSSHEYQEWPGRGELWCPVHPCPADRFHSLEQTDVEKLQHHLTSHLFHGMLLKTSQIHHVLKTELMIFHLSNTFYTNFSSTAPGIFHSTSGNQHWTGFTFPLPPVCCHLLKFKTDKSLSIRYVY